ncbi:MAG: hypothetical protein ACTSPD_01460 [Promethearchaeota archaeon]
MEQSIDDRPETSIDHDIKIFKEYVKERKFKWSKKEKKELEDDKFDTEESLKNSSVHFSEMEYHIIDDALSDFINSGIKIIGFDESSNTFPGTYARLASFKFGECQVSFKNGKYNVEKIMYKPINGYIEDNEHKLIIYKTVIENFVKTIKKDFYVGELKNKVDKLEEWYENTYKKKIEAHIKAHNFYYPSIGHVVDRIRTADEIIKSLIRIKNESNWGINKNIVFLGDGIQMFRQQIFPPTAFTEFFYKFVETYNINYFTFSKTCRLRDAQGNFILPIWDEILEGKRFLVELPDLLPFTKSKAYIVRLQEQSSALRFDIPDYLDTIDAINIIKNLIQYSPVGYPICLIGAHESSKLLVSEYNKIEGKFLELKYDKKTKKYTEVWRHKVLND